MRVPVEAVLNYWRVNFKHRNGTVCPEDSNLTTVQFTYAQHLACRTAKLWPFQREYILSHSTL